MKSKCLILLCSLFLILMVTETNFACSCAARSTVLNSFEYSDLVIIAKAVSVEMREEAKGVDLEAGIKKAGYDNTYRYIKSAKKFFIEVEQKTNFQRFAYDFAIVDENGLNYKGQPRLNDDWYYAKPDTMEDYFSYGQPIYAAGAGRVAAVRDDKANREFNPNELAEDERAFYGNYVVIDHLNGEFSIFAHLKKGSALVKTGQMVKQGEMIASIGATGSSLFPHLHYELRNGAGAKTVEGLPSYFSNFRRLLGSSSVNIKKGAVNTGDIVDWQLSTKIKR